MRLVEVINKEITISNSFRIEGEQLIEETITSGCLKPSIMILNAKKLVDYRFVMPYEVVLQIAGLTMDEINEKLRDSILNYLRDGKVMNSDLRVNPNVIYAFTIPAIYEALGFVELQFFEDGKVRNIFFFDLSLEELDAIENIKSNNESSEAKVVGDHSPLVSTQESCKLTLSRCVRERLYGNRKPIAKANVALLLVSALSLFILADPYGVYVLMLALAIVSANLSCYLLISTGFYFSKTILMNPFVSWFSLKRHEYLNLKKHKWVNP